MDLGNVLTSKFPELGFYKEALTTLEAQLNNTGANEYVELFYSLPCHENVIVLVSLMVFDFLVGKRTKARWFAVHAFANLLVVLAGFNAVVTALKDPLHACDSAKYNDDSFGGDASRYPVIITNSVHIYHMIAFKLTGADYFHHLLFLPTIGFAGQYYDWGAVSAFNGFFMSGLPGGLDYFILVLVKHDVVSAMTQKHLCACINVYLRGPAILCVAMLLYIGVLYDFTTVPLYATIPIALLAAFNSLYYIKQSVANYSITHALEHSNSMTFPIDKKLMKVIKAPQNNMC
uniref:Uncharacterized protein n=1 Tax=Aplanochytrium stocchinoi TaxID=215587 RepID=A0A7S3PSQ0_9STRA|mmetsp:Transcript_21217/g.25813  ORF Transcript_21217/g.25813 Transcript_21217/m.25813 type:complete len:289 (-) Transcript_21217:309-1175(-)